jgi:hypothetical protein
MGRTCSTNWQKGKAHEILMGKPEGTGSLERSKRKWVDNIEMDLR